ncbi:MAG: alkaline phosphatase family protein, partial [Alphaproteobacteria bacterium]
MKSRVLIVSFDALRPDMVTPDLMPNLCKFVSESAHFPEARSTFPTETRVNQTAMITGCYPERHGIVGNRFQDADASPGRLFNTGDETQLAEGDKRLGGKLVDVPVLGEILDA